MEEKESRIKYIRSLDRFLNKSHSLLKKSNITPIEFTKKIKTNYKFMQNLKRPKLNSQYLCMLQFVADELLRSCEKEIENLADLQNTILKQYNLAQKEKNRLSYKKSKHKKDQFDESL